MHICRLQIHALARLIALTVISVSISFTGIACVSQHQLNPLSDNAPQAPTAFTGLPPLSRLASASGDFLVYQDGADFAADLDYSRCAPSGTSADLTPDYVGRQEPLSDAAYGLYRLELDPAATSATLTLAWSGAVPASADCWVGLSDWARGRWDWQPLAGNEIAISNPAAYGDAAKHCYVALVLLGNTPGELVSISFGPKPPASNGYTLFAPSSDTSTCLIDDKGVVVHTWPGQYRPGMVALLAADGYLWRQVQLYNPGFSFGGTGGRLEKVDWDGNVVWSFELNTATQCTHHDFELLPNGNVLLTVWNKYTKAQAIAAGRDQQTLGEAGSLVVDAIIEIEPTQQGAIIVWQWYLMDHVVQDFDSSKANYGDPAAHPELVDLNYTAMRTLDWTHVNTLSYNADLDQIALSVLGVCELWIIDHSTSTEEAAGHTGGRSGRGGDLLFRWGNQAAYGAGLPSDQKLCGQHDVDWIAPGLPGAGDLLMFNNKAGTLGGEEYSTVLEITPPLNPDGSYYMTDSAYGPDGPVWQYKADPPGAFFSVNISGAQRLPDGNTLICQGQGGKLFEVTSAGENVWQYLNPFPIPGSPVFRATRYPSDYPGLANLPK